jgi:hypothetical protein
MSRFEEEETAIEQWLAGIKPVSVDEFCQCWVPVIYKIQPEDGLKYRRACVTLIAEIAGKNRKTVQNWLSYPHLVPDHINKLLGTLNRLWQIRLHVRDMFPENGNK